MYAWNEHFVAWLCNGLAANFIMKREGWASIPFICGPCSQSTCFMPVNALICERKAEGAWIKACVTCPRLSPAEKWKEFNKPAASWWAWNIKPSAFPLRERGGGTRRARQVHLKTFDSLLLENAVFVSLNLAFRPENETAKHPRAWAEPWLWLSGF